MMPAMPEKPAATPIPVQLSASEFTQFILPHLTMPKRGPRCKLGYHRVFNLIFMGTNLQPVTSFRGADQKYVASLRKSTVMVRLARVR
jgi:hypothetical protein